MLRGDRLRELREKNRLSREKLTAYLEIGPNQVARYESGENDPSGEIIKRLAQFFSVSTDYLLGLTDDPSPHVAAGELNEKEIAALTAWRRGERFEAVRVIVNDE